MTFDLYALQFATSTAAHHADGAIARVGRFQADEARDKRIGERRCRRCYYLIARVCGQGFSEWTCRSCDASYMHHNTWVPQLCYACATRYGACVECTADLDLTEGRRALVRKKQLPPCSKRNGRPRPSKHQEPKP